MDSWLLLKQKQRDELRNRHQEQFLLLRSKIKGLDDEILGELNSIVALANAGNRLTDGYQLPVDDMFQSKQLAPKWKYEAKTSSAASNKVKKRARSK